MSTETINQLTISRWTKATFWGWLLGVALIILLSSFLDSVGIEDMQFYLGVGMGAGVGLSQWLVLKKFVTVSKSWIWFSIVGMGIPFIILDLLPAGTVAHKLPWSVILGSLAVAFLQYTFLKTLSQNGYLWLFGCFFGWTLAIATVFTIDYTNHLKEYVHYNLVLAFINLLLILGGGIVLGIVTGIALKKILH